jgi:ubiquitin carboxyl-terminal hydrolase L5
LLENIGVKGVEVEELHSLDPASLQKFSPVYGLIFLFKWQKEEDPRPVLSNGAPGVFFAKQVISNACATQAIISVLMNQPDVEIGSVLQEFKDFTVGMPSDISGLAISNSDAIRTSHNSFARAEPFISGEKKVATEDDDVFHFVGYVPVGDKVYELDGLKEGPIEVGDAKGKDWLQDVAVPAIQQRMAKYSQKEVRFALLAVVKNQLEHEQTKLAELQAKAASIDAKLADPTAMDTNSDSTEALPTDPDSLQMLKLTTENEVKQVKYEIQTQTSKRARWSKENQRRKHNYLPFVFNLITLLAKNKKLTPLIAEAKTARQEAIANAAKAKATSSA